jgi:hypothetical protein
MLGPKQEAQGALFYGFSIDDPVPQDLRLRSIDRFVDLSGIRQHLPDFNAIPVARPLIPNCWSGYCWLAIASGSDLSGDYADRFT